MVLQAQWYIYVTLAKYGPTGTMVHICHIGKIWSYRHNGTYMSHWQNMVLQAQWYIYVTLAKYGPTGTMVHIYHIGKKKEVFIGADNQNENCIEHQNNIYEYIL